MTSKGPYKINCLSNLIIKRTYSEGGLSWKNDFFKKGVFHKELPEGVKPTHIVVGAGSAGCVLANRLTEDPNNRVLLIEAGPKGDK